MNAAIYARVSTLKGQEPEMQLREIREYCARRGWYVAGEYVDRGVSGAKESRPELDRLMSVCRTRAIDAVIVYRYDRFARSLRQLVNALEEFRALRIDFISLHEGVDTSTPNGRLVFGIFASIAEFERELIRDRVRSGIASARARGKRLGRPRVPVNAATIAVLRNQGLSWAQITEELSISKGTAQRAVGFLEISHKSRWCSQSRELDRSEDFSECLVIPPTTRTLQRFRTSHKPTYGPPRSRGSTSGLPVICSRSCESSRRGFQHP